MKLLIVVDMQNDFISGALGSPEALAILPRVEEKIKNFQGDVLFTRDTHSENYMETAEGKKLPVLHCVKGTPGWEIHGQLQPYACHVLDKPSFGSLELAERVKELLPEEVTLVGLCTDICVISNALIIKAALPETEIIVDASCCAGVTPESHKRALEAMQVCQIAVEFENL